MTKTNEYTVKRVDDDIFELWRDDKRLATLTKKEAWPVMMGQVHPSAVVRKQTEAATTTQARSDD